MDAVGREPRLGRLNAESGALNLLSPRIQIASVWSLIAPSHRRWLIGTIESVLLSGCPVALSQHRVNEFELRSPARIEPQRGDGQFGLPIFQSIGWKGPSPAVPSCEPSGRRVLRGHASGQPSKRYDREGRGRKPSRPPSCHATAMYPPARNT